MQIKPKKTTRPDQIVAIEAICKELAIASRTKLISACGTGKTLTALWAAQKMQAQNILIALPNLLLQAQSLASWLDDTRDALNHSILVVGSDKSIAKRFDVLVTTDSLTIADFLQSQQPKIVFTTYHSVAQLSEGCRMAGMEFDLLIIDEAHRTVGEDKRYFSSFLQDATSVVCKKRLFLTATERFIEGDNVFSMDDETIYGRTAHELKIVQAIEMGILSDYKVLLMYIEEPPTGELDTQQLAFDALKKAIETYHLRRIITYHSSINRAKAFQTAFAESGYIAYHFNHTDKTRYRLNTLEAMKEIAEPVIITNAQALTEGFDLPETDCVAMIDQRKTVSDIIQQIGRVLRKSPKKKESYVFIPVFVTKNGLLDEMAFETTRKTLVAMASVDGRIADSFKAKSSSIFLNQSGRTNPNILLSNLPTKISERISTIVWSNIKNLYWRSVEDAQVFVRSLVEYNITSVENWLKYCKGEIKNVPPKPVDIPKSLPAVYNKPYSFFLTKLKSYEDAKEWMVQNFPDVKTGKEFVRLKKEGLIPKNIGGEKEYRWRSEWKGYRDFFDTTIKSYEEAKEWMAQNFPDVKTGEEFVRLKKEGVIPRFIAGEQHYKERGEWKGYRDFFNTKYILSSYEESKKWMAQNFPDVKTSTVFIKLKKEGVIPKKIGGEKEYTRSGEWKGYKDFLNNQTK